MGLYKTSCKTMHEWIALYGKNIGILLFSQQNSLAPNCTAQNTLA